MASLRFLCLPVCSNGLLMFLIFVSHLFSYPGKPQHHKILHRPLIASDVPILLPYPAFAYRNLL